MAGIPFAADPLTNIINVTWDSGLFAFGGAVGPGNGVAHIQIAKDGKTWQALTSVESVVAGGAYSLAFGNGCWVLLATQTGVLYRSTDTHSWSSVATTGQPGKVIFAKPRNASVGRFYATCFDSDFNPAIFSSSDGITWSSTALAASDQPSCILVTQANDALYAATVESVPDDWSTHESNVLYRSLDGVTWTSLGELASGIEWDTGTVDFGLVPGDRRLVDVAFGNSIYLTLLQISIQTDTLRRKILAVCKSTDGLSFGSPLSLDVDVRDANSNTQLAFGDRFVTGGGHLPSHSVTNPYSGRVGYSSDGAAWTYVDLISSGPSDVADFRRVAASGKKIIAIADYSGTSIARTFFGDASSGAPVWSEVTNSFNQSGVASRPFFAAALSAPFPA